MAQFRLTKNDQKQFHFSLVNEDEHTLVQSEMYNSKESALNGIESVRVNSVKIEQYDYLTSKNGQFYFNLSAANGQVIATSRMYNTATARDQVAKVVQTEAAQAKVIEE